LVWAHNPCCFGCAAGEEVVSDEGEVRKEFRTLELVRIRDQVVCRSWMVGRDEVTSFDALMKNLVKVGDEVAKVCFSVSSPLLHELNSLFLQIHPYVYFAWQVLSAGMKVSHFLLLVNFFLIYICSIRWSKPNRLETSRF
jgi:hypothetical protein